MFEQTKKLVEKRFPEHHLRVVGGFYFLRFLCPALVCPEGFRLIPAPPAAKSRRSLILVSKILQNLANDVEFGEKESYMVSVNGFIKSNQTTMWSFLEQLSSPPKPRVTQTFVEMKQDPLAAIYQCIQSNREKLGAILTKSGQSHIFESLCAALDTYNTGAIKVRRSSMAPHPTSLSSPATDIPARKRSASALPAFSSPISTPLSPTSTRVAELIPISSSPSQSLTNLLQLNLQHSSPVTNSPDLSLRLQKLKQSGDRFTEKLGKFEKFEKLDENANSKTESEPERSHTPTNELADSAKLPRPPTPSLSTLSPSPTPPTTGSSPALPELEIELKKQMQEIQALKLALESGGMGLKERSETHQRFVGLLQHLKTMLATYKERKEKGEGGGGGGGGGGGNKENDELAALVEEAQLS